MHFLAGLPISYFLQGKTRRHISTVTVAITLSGVQFVENFIAFVFNEFVFPFRKKKVVSGAQNLL